MFDLEKILAISELTFRKVKEPAFMLLFVVAGVIGYCVSEIGNLLFSDSDVLLAGMIATEHGTSLRGGVLLIFTLSLLVAVFSGATDIPRDIESRMVMLILAKPVKRHEYLLGKFIGILTICIVFFMIAFSVASIAHVIKSGEFFPLNVLIRQLFLILAFFPFVAMTIVISTYLSDISAMIVTVLFLIFSIVISGVMTLVEMLPKSIDTTSIIYLVYYFFPNYFYFLHSFNNFGFVAFSLVIYSLSISTIFLLIASNRLKNRDMI